MIILIIFGVSDPGKNILFSVMIIYLIRSSAFRLG